MALFARLRHKYSLVIADDRPEDCFIICKKYRVSMEEIIP